MDSLLFAQLASTVIFVAGTLIFGEIRNARGVFAIFMISGSFLPFALSYLAGIESPISDMPLMSPEGEKSVVLCVIAFAVVISTSLFVEKTRAGLPNGKIYGPNGSISRVFSWLAILTSIAYIGLMALRMGGLGNLIIRLYQRTSLNDSVANYLVLLSFASMVFSVFGFCFARGGRSTSAKLLSYVSVLVCLVEMFMSGGRSNVILFVLALFYVSLTRMSLARFTIAAAIAAVLMAGTSYFMTNARFEAQHAAVLKDRADESFISRATTGLQFIDRIAASIAYVEQRGHDFGETYVNVLLLPIPRDLWPDKPYQISNRLRQFLFGDLTGGEPPGLFGEGYIGFGTIGVVGAAMVLGWMIGRINSTTVVAKRTGCRAREACAGVLAPLIAYAVVRGGFDIAGLRVGVPAFWCWVSIKIADQLLARQAVRANHRRKRRPYSPAEGRQQPNLAAIAHKTGSDLS